MMVANSEMVTREWCMDSIVSRSLGSVAGLVLVPISILVSPDLQSCPMGFDYLMVPDQDFVGPRRTVELQ